jgi:DNA-binding response OmpR family regulator
MRGVLPILLGEDSAQDFLRVDQVSPAVLVVDDDPTILDLLATLLSGEGYAVATADGGREALEIAGRLRPSIVLLDMRMPEVDGWQVARGLAKRGLRPKIVVMSALSDRLDEVARDLRASGYLEKPFDVAKLLATVKSLSSL